LAGSTFTASLWRRYRTDAAVLSCCLLFALASRAATRSTYLFSWDAVNFALAMDRWNLALHQPHPAGYLSYVALARLARSWGADHNLALQSVAMAAIGVAAWVWWRLAQQFGARRWEATAGAVLLLTSPLVWLYSSVAEVYTLDLLATLLVIAAIVDNDASINASRWKVGLAFLFAASVRLPTAVLLLPTVVARPRHIWSRAAIAVVAVLVAVAGIAIADPNFAAAFGSHMAFTTQETRIFGGAEDALESLNRNTRDLLRAVFMAGFATAALLLLGIWRARRHSFVDVRLAAAWALPMIAVFTFIHFGKQGYLLPLLPLAYLYVASGIRSIGAAGPAIAALAIAAQVLQFFAAGPFSPARMGAGKRYGDKTFWEKVATELDPVTFATRDTIAREDARVEAFVSRLARDCPDTRVVVVGSAAVIDWRRAMFYAPRDTLVQYAGPDRPLLIAHNRRVRVGTESEQLQAPCAPLWIGGSTPPVMTSDGEGGADEIGAWTLPDVLTFEFAGGQHVTISR
jgi:hypothetical protein